MTRRLALLLSIVATRPAFAQATAGVIVGRVLGDSSGAPVAGADVSVPAIGRTVRTDAEGRFRIDGLPGGALAVQIRSVGFAPLRAQATLLEGDTLRVDLRLVRTLTELARVTVRDEAPKVNPEFDRRASSGIGTFLRPAFFEDKRDQRLSDAVRRVSGMQIQVLPGGGYAFASRRGVDGNSAGLRGPRSKLPPACYAAVYLDGVRIFAGEGAPPKIDDILPMGDVGALEYYSGPARTPTELNATGSACGTVVIWSRR